MATLPSIDQDQLIVDEVIRETERPAGVGKPKIEYHSDHSGDEAVYLTFPASKKVPLSRQRVKNLAAFSMLVLDNLYQRNIQRIPYVRFSETR